MKKIGTHNSATGFPGHGILSWLGTPFARCQSKTIAEQYNAGCRYFDIRIKETKRGWVCAHGIWQSRKSVHDILHEIDAYNDCCVMLTYEGEAPDDFIDVTDTFVSTYTGITFTCVNTKKPEWKVLKTYNNIPVQSDFVNLDGRSWHTYIPIPWLWKKIYKNHPEFNDECFTLVDFL